MPATHDGISTRLPPDPLRLVIGLALLGGAGYLASIASYLPAVGLALVGLVLLLNQFGSRRIRVIETKLLVEDEHLLMALLIGPSRNRIEWGKVKSISAEGGRLTLLTDGAPFVTAQGATKDDLEFLRERAQAALDKSRRA